jgi:hypothetical protein
MPADQKPQSATPSGWRDSYPDGVGGWPDLYKRLDALASRDSTSSRRSNPRQSTPSHDAEIPTQRRPDDAGLPADYRVNLTQKSCHNPVISKAYTWPMCIVIKVLQLIIRVLAMMC